MTAQINLTQLRAELAMNPPDTIFELEHHELAALIDTAEAAQAFIDLPELAPYAEHDPVTGGTIGYHARRLRETLNNYTT